MAIHGYVRCSLLKREKPPEAQIEEFARRAKDLGGVLTRVFVDPVYTGKKTAILKRPVGKEMLETLRAGDTLIVTRLDRLGYSLRDVMATVRALSERGVQICTTELDVSPDVGRGIVQLFGLLKKTEKALCSERLTESVQWRKQRGLAYCNPPMARRIVRQGSVKFLEWDEQQLRYIMEIAERLPREGAAKVAEDFWRRGIKDRRGRLWGKQARKATGQIQEVNCLLRCFLGKRNRAVSPYQQFYRAVRWFHRAKRKGELPTPYGELGESIQEPRGFREKPKRRKRTRGGTARREQERADAKAKHRAERLARWQVERAARVEARVHKPKVMRQRSAPILGE